MGGLSIGRVADYPEFLNEDNYNNLRYWVSAKNAYGASIRHFKSGKPLGGESSKCTFSGACTVESM